MSLREGLIRCYPARWRARYGEEFLALLEERPVGPYDVADILLGALDARLRPRERGTGSHDRKGLPMSLRLGGITAIVGAIAFASAGFLGLGGGIIPDAVSPILVCMGALALLAAITVLSAYQARAYPRLVWAAFALAAIGSVAFLLSAIGLSGLLDVGQGDDSGVVVGLALAGLGGLTGYALFGLATYRADVLSRPGAALIAIGPVVIVAAIGVAMVDWNVGGYVLSAGLATFALGWLVLGLTAIRLDATARAARPA